MAEDNANKLNLRSVLDISKTGELRSQLLDALASGIPTVLNAADVERIDASALQTLSAYTTESEVAGIRFEWTEVSPAFEEAARLTGLAETLRLPDSAD
jgi:anti-anti-sigma regulatory factor